ncbi:hypothetical protein WS86_29805 [Burkholderia savannae]|uniref:Uncharacterized protein n=1 Tax=Burkholderia savannae TaxID=1637837 RepID=A0ABR5T2A6_9BURK|nr:hypothetical protein WS86_29805 [Burkholderia savannae]KWZ37360.1 hypothetical protein WS72_20430 [Burkholderia savannae]
MRRPVVAVGFDACGVNALTTRDGRRAPPLRTASRGRPPGTAFARAAAEDRPMHAEAGRRRAASKPGSRHADRARFDDQ